MGAVGRSGAHAPIHPFAQFLAGLEVWHMFAGQGVPDGQKSLAIEVTLQPGEKSYTDDDLKAIADKVTAAAAKLGAALRR